jgi:hypothetical protein
MPVGAGDVPVFRMYQVALRDESVPEMWFRGRYLTDIDTGKQAESMSIPFPPDSKQKWNFPPETRRF